MPPKEGETVCHIKEQIIEDPVTGLTIQFEAVPGGEYRVRLFTPVIPLGTANTLFDKEGTRWARGTLTTAYADPRG